MRDHLESERAEPGQPASEVLEALADPDALVVAVRDDGKVAVTRGLPRGIDATTLSAPILAVQGPPRRP